MNFKRFTKNGKMLMLALDHRGSFRKLINPNDPDSVNPEKAIEFKKRIINSVQSLTTGNLIDFEYGLPAYFDLDFENPKPFVLPAEKTGYIDKGQGRITELEKSGKDIKDQGALGMKLLVYYNDADPSSKQQIETAHKFVTDAKNNNLTSFLEIVTYGGENPILKVLISFLQDGVFPDVFKIQYPGSKSESALVSHLLGGIPWIMLTRGDNFENFSSNLQIAADSGCKGFLAGRSLWQDGLGLTDPKEQDKFFAETLPERFTIISEIVLNS